LAFSVSRGVARSAHGIRIGVLLFARQRFPTRCASRLVRFRSLGNRRQGRWRENTGCGGSSGASERMYSQFLAGKPQIPASRRFVQYHGADVGDRCDVVCALIVSQQAGPCGGRRYARHGPVPRAVRACVSHYRQKRQVVTKTAPALPIKPCQLRPDLHGQGSRVGAINKAAQTGAPAVADFFSGHPKRVGRDGQAKGDLFARPGIWGQIPKGRLRQIGIGDPPL